MDWLFEMRRVCAHQVATISISNPSAKLDVVMRALVHVEIFFSYGNLILSDLFII